MKRYVCLALLASLTAAAFAQEQGTPKEVASLGWLVGSWTGSGKISFGGNETDITSQVTFTFDGEFLKEVSADKSADFTLTKTTMTGWDPLKNEYDSFSFTNIAPTARVAKGKMEGGKLVLVSDPWGAEGMTAVMRETISKVSDSKFEYVIEFKSGEKWSTGMDFVLSKQ